MGAWNIRDNSGGNLCPSVVGKQGWGFSAYICAEHGAGGRDSRKPTGLQRKGRNMRLENNQQFPTIVARRVQGGEMTIPADLAERWGVLLFYRGQW